MMFGYEKEFDSDNNLKKYEHLARMLYALKLRFGIDDIDSVAAEALTDNSGDCKCDLIYIDDDTGTAVIAQSYEREQQNRAKSPKTKKATDLNTAIGWILGRDLHVLPIAVKSASEQLRNAINDGKIGVIYCWFVHNAKYSEEIDNEMLTVRETGHAVLSKCFPNSGIQVHAEQINDSLIEEMFQNKNSKVLVKDTIELELPYSTFEISGSRWSACQASRTYGICHENAAFTRRQRKGK